MHKLTVGGGLAHVPDDELLVIANRAKHILVLAMPGDVLDHAHVLSIDRLRLQDLRPEEDRLRI